MAELIKSTEKSKDTNLVKEKKNEFDTVYFRVFDLVILICSFLSVLSDLCTDLILVVQYSYQGYQAWAIATFILIFFPSLIVQFFSMRWHVSDQLASTYHWIFHFFMLGILQRYISIIKSGYSACKSKDSSKIQRIVLDHSDLCMLHLFESFLESSPQLVLQVYVISKLNEWRFWTVFSALISLLSLSWALAAYSKTQRLARPNKNCSTWIGLFFQALSSAGILLARIAALVLGAYYFGKYIFLLITIHWFTMTIWVIYQKTDFCESYWEEKIYNAVVGVIYCFCFFNLQEGHSRWRILIFHILIIFENFICLILFLVYFGKTAPKLALFGFVAVVGGTFLGMMGMLVYYRFFHPSGPIKFWFTSVEATSKTSMAQEFSSMTLRSLKQLRVQTSNYKPPKNTNDTNFNQSFNPSADSVIIIEDIESDSDSDIKTLREWINEKESKIMSVQAENTSSPVSSNNSRTLKRRAICSTPHLIKLLQCHNNTEVNSTTVFQATIHEETPSEFCPAHNYENLCSVNINREIKGIRSWKDYTDIDNRLHDASIANNEKLHDKNITSLSDKSAVALKKQSTKFMQSKEIENDKLLFEKSFCETVEQCSLNTLLATCSLDRELIFEAEGVKEGTEIPKEKCKEKILSGLVATIDEIRFNTPTCNQCPLSEPFRKSTVLCHRKLILN